MSTGREKRRWHPYDIALTAANLLLAAYIIYLLLANYHSQSKLRQSAEEAIASNAEKQATAIGYYLSERRRDIQRLAADPAITAYFENKALGMSLEYGLQAALDQARRTLQKLTQEKAITGCNAFSHLHLSQEDGTLLASIDSDPSQNERHAKKKIAENKPCGLYKIESDSLLIEQPVLFKGQKTGHLTAWVPLKPVLTHQISQQSAAAGHWSALYYRGQPVFSPASEPHAPPLPARPDVITHGGTLISLAAIPDTELFLATATPIANVVGYTSPLQQLLGIGAVAAVLLFGLIGFLRHIERKRMEQTVRESDERLSLALQASNRELESRVRERTAMLLQAEKMASIGQLAAGVAHEINNPAGFVCGNLDVLRKYAEGLLLLANFCEQTAQQLCAGTLPPTDAASGIRQISEEIDLNYIRKDLPDLLNESQEGMRRIARIVCDLKDFSHIDKDNAVSGCNLNELIEKAINVAWNELKYKCEIRKEYGDLPPVQANGGQISQVVLNLLVNAAQAIEKFGTIIIRTGCEADAVRMDFIDNGPGIPEAIRSRIFDPFFTTKTLGKGTGLGLHICQKIIHGHGGTITVESKAGEGAAFIIRLPLKQSAPAIDASPAFTCVNDSTTGTPNE